MAGEQEARRMAAVVRSGNWSWLGEHERAFCQAYAGYIGTEHALCMANGTVTLQCALQAVGIVPGDEVIVPALTWVATAQAALDIGASVVLVDVDPDSLCISPAAVRAAITPRTRAIVPVHLYGCMCDMDAIMEIAGEHDLRVVEDVAHQHGSSWRGTRAGAIGDVGSYSFQQSKILTSGEGGAVTCDDDDVYRTMFALKQVGWMPDPTAAAASNAVPPLVPGNRYGHNYRITEMQCVLLRGGLERLPAQNARRAAAAERLAAGLLEIGGPLRAARRDPRVSEQAYYAMTMHLDAAAAGISRDAYRRALAAEGLSLGTPYPPVYRSPLLNLQDHTSPIPFRARDAVQNYAALDLPNTERAVNETALVLAHQHLLGDDRYVDALLAAIGKVNDALPALADWAQHSP
jgi:L-glutamine:2-deoxy-scyllo-inosose/3-amino-2,3-dideoxy-scyllo-inosose aminotransferase